MNTYDPWYDHDDERVRMAYAGVNGSYVHVTAHRAVLANLHTCESEHMEQARLLGMSAERELALRAKVEKREGEVTCLLAQVSGLRAEITDLVAMRDADAYLIGRLHAEVERKDGALKRIAEYKCHDIALGYEYFVDTRDIAREALRNGGA